MGPGGLCPFIFGGAFIINIHMPIIASINDSKTQVDPSRAIPIDEVEPAAEIVKRFATGKPAPGPAHTNIFFRRLAAAAHD